MFGSRKKKEHATPAEDTPELRLAAAGEKVAECEQRLKEHDSGIASWAAGHGLHFDDEGAVSSWHPDRVEEFKRLNEKRNEAWHQFQASLAGFARAKQETMAIA
jgi:hypothetical protein